MRDECLDCVRKHVGSALAAEAEIYTKYPHHITRVVGELDQAYQEAIKKYMHIADMIYEYRMEVEDAYGQIIAGIDPEEVYKNAPSDEELVQAIHTCYLQVQAENEEEG